MSIARDRVLCLLALIGLGNPIPAQGQSFCKTAESTAEQAQCATAELDAAEKDLKDAFAAALAWFTETADQRRKTAALPKSEREQQVQWEQRIMGDLHASQAAWLQYRKSACGAVKDKYTGGTMMKVATPSCEAELTRARAKFLRDYFGEEQ